MVEQKSISVWRLVILPLAVLLFISVGPAYCQADNTALLLQQTPDGAGSITPDAGVHQLGLNTDISLTAVPKPGYQFVYWIGDVSDPRASSTTVYLDSPKIVVAVFERSQYELLVAEVVPKSAPGGGMIASTADYSRAGGGGGGRRSTYEGGRRVTPSEPEEEEPDEDFPIPEEKEPDEFPIPEPIPEPATAVLLFMGSWLAFIRRRPKHKNNGKISAAKAALEKISLTPKEQLANLKN